MFDGLDPVLLSRIQFAFTISFHILFPAFTIGLASWLAVLEWRWLRTGNPVYAEVYRMWVKIFAVTFGMGVVSGVVMSFQLGTNWSVFSDRAGNVLGPLLGFEVLTAFFLEASFLGVMLFGWNRVSPRMHFSATVIVAVGTLISAFWILSANSWMQTPQGFAVAKDGLFYPSNWLQIIFNPSFPFRFVHMVTAAYLTTAFVVAGVGAFYLWRSIYLRHARVMLGMAMIMAIFVAPVQLLLGDMHGLNTLEHQPTKVAAIEGLWETERGAPLRLFGWPDQEHEITRYAIEIPRLSSLILTHSLDGEVKGLKHWPRNERPPVAAVFWSFRIMVGIGILMIVTGLSGLVLFLRKRLFDTRWFQYWCMALTPAGFLAVLAGWLVTEVGRQPYIIQGYMRTADAGSPLLSTPVAMSLTAFIVTYSFVFGAGTYYILKLIANGPDTEDDAYGSHGVKQPPLITTLGSEKGGRHV
ncbi:cytochrome ubiquinol oxidase subunit I [Desulfoferrobacter suflitae]|uniref:cytochrome ubiquinol oxidase subunit I n=1 Tax=Desulfoferrobacter suflitae TaxID=2865782 RepID=UPI0021646CB2|nr:cytochrome ubiquinol oxidase subunit I [Desulfoferrobacter suflitae]MCK8600638.1 cytochrome ubiquinol oxidase subunit I [Desulfoferrobacter suflitae]